MIPMLQMRKLRQSAFANLKSLLPLSLVHFSLQHGSGSLSSNSSSDTPFTVSCLSPPLTGAQHPSVWPPGLLSVWPVFILLCPVHQQDQLLLTESFVGLCSLGTSSAPTLTLISV